MVFLAAIVVPVTRRPEYRSIAASLIHLTGVRFRWIGWICMVLLILTGTFNLIYRGLDLGYIFSGRIWTDLFGKILMGKLLLVSLILLMSIVHDFMIGPRATALWRENPVSPDALRLRRQASWIGRLNLILALIGVALGVMLVRGSPL